MSSTRIDKAIILAAGMGKRIAGEGSNIPKPLLPLDDSGKLTFVDWHLRSLAAHGAKEIYLVGSKATFGTKVAAMENVPATWIMNDFPGDVSGSGHSTHLAFTSEHNILDGKSRVVLMDADVVYDPSLFGDLAAKGGRSKTLVCGAFRETDEEVMVFGDERGTPRMHGKGLLNTPLVRGLTCMGEATGLLLLEPEDHAFWLAASAWCMKFSTAKTRTEHEDITGRLMAAGALDAVVFDDDARCMECDTPDEYVVVRREMVPRWRDKLP
ncbi:UDP-N-acetylglucosamine pyrophosphorylase related protein [Labilithrix luteola]|uniref:UDP-N-acetylglucosamine pyrophosphorylase related protein n=1 Tax=Labilithrix luteola TaxID=1391654 RepID=A0A0K1QDD9_9BACT|nr:NTP transferase domain-containing protein [Labilithrix luteola]AKV03728.1 UDP-N-acetylglucosamine pyrophosphorylase related protein [Labilithrix luteola]